MIKLQMLNLPTAESIRWNHSDLFALARFLAAVCGCKKENQEVLLTTQRHELLPPTVGLVLLLIRR